MLRFEDSRTGAAALDKVSIELATCAARAQQSDAEFDALVTGCGSGVFMLDSGDHIERASPEACRLLGLQQKQVEGRSLLQVTLSSELQTQLRLARETNTEQKCEIRAPGNTSACIGVTIVPTRLAAAPVARCLVITIDISELRRLETVRRDFVANVSHELRTPLTSIRAMAETLQNGAIGDADVADHFLATISAEVQRLTRISEDLPGTIACRVSPGRHRQAASLQPAE